MLQRRIILCILFAISLLSGASFFLLLQYFDPYIHPTLALSFLTMSFVFSLTSMVALMLYFLKKIHYRGEVGIYHILSSVRQGLFVSAFFCSAVVFQIFHIPYILPLFLSFVILILLEFLIQGF